MPALLPAPTMMEKLFPPAPLPPLHQNTTSLQQAMHQNTVGVGYSGSGYEARGGLGATEQLEWGGSSGTAALTIAPAHTLRMLMARPAAPISQCSSGGSTRAIG